MICFVLLGTFLCFFGWFSSVLFVFLISLNFLKDIFGVYCYFVVLWVDFFSKYPSEHPAKAF